MRILAGLWKSEPKDCGVLFVFACGDDVVWLLRAEADNRFCMADLAGLVRLRNLSI